MAGNDGEFDEAFVIVGGTETNEGKANVAVGTNAAPGVPRGVVGGADVVVQAATDIRIVRTITALAYMSRSLIR